MPLYGLILLVLLYVIIMNDELIDTISFRTRLSLLMMVENDESCLIDSIATNLILREAKYFQTLLKRTKNMTAIVGNNGHIVGSSQAIVVLPNDTRIFIEEMFMYPLATHTLLTFKDICHSGYHVTTMCEGGVEYLHIIASNEFETKVVNKVQDTSSRLSYTKIKPTPEFVVMSTIFKNSESFRVWRERLGHHGLRMM
jgi:hypothetical protein